MSFPLALENYEENYGKIHLTHIKEMFMLCKALDFALNKPSITQESFNNKGCKFSLYPSLATLVSISSQIHNLSISSQVHNSERFPLFVGMMKDF
jgi:hypothetical protein